MCKRSELVGPLVKQTKQNPEDYPNDKAGDDLTQSQFFWWGGFWRSRSNSFSFDLIYFCGRCWCIQQSYGGFGIRSANQQAHAAWCRQIWIHPTAVISINPTFDTVSFKICCGQPCGVVVVESANGNPFHFVVKAVIGWFQSHNLAKE